MSAAVDRLAAPLRSLAWFVGVGALVYAGAVVWAGSQATWAAAARLEWTAMAAGTAVASAGYLVRWGRWRWMMRCFGHRVPMGYELRVYLTGLALTSTPAKLGETVRSAFLLRQGVRVSDSLAAFFADRLSDVVGVALLGVLAAAWTGGRLQLLEALAALALAAAFLLRAGVRSSRWLSWMAALQQRGRPGRWLAAAAYPAAAWAQLWAPHRVPGFAAAALLAYGLQALVFSQFVAAVALPLPVPQCVAIYASATLIGAASMVPAGLGVMEAALALQLTQAGAAADAAIAVALLTRVSTLWFGLLLGALALLSIGAEPAAAGPESAREPVDG